MPSAVDAGPCTNCGAGPVDRFCAACGQRHVTPEDFTARHFLRELLSEFVSLDGRFWLTLWTLVRHPGKLAREYFDGRGARYMRPLNLFLLLNLVFFVIQPHTGMLQWHLKGYLQNTVVAPRLVEEARRSRAEDAERDREKSGAAPAPPTIESMDVFESNFEATLQNLKKSMLLLAIPLFAIALLTVYGTNHRIAEHLIFSTHFYAFAVFALTVLVPAGFEVVRGSLRALHAPSSAFAALNTETALSVALLVLFGSYLYVGVRRMYGDSRLAGAIRAFLLSVSYQLIVVMFALSAFRVTLWAM
ncbi:MAG: DUF3667 domain-containing protein [Gemmatimonadetes bacterium]|nr:DUF3667 domain-containing protein [Gemmatimonadota bacterium]